MLSHIIGFQGAINMVNILRNSLSMWTGLFLCRLQITRKCWFEISFKTATWKQRLGLIMFQPSPWNNLTFFFCWTLKLTSGVKGSGPMLPKWLYAYLWIYKGSLSLSNFYPNQNAISSFSLHTHLPLLPPWIKHAKRKSIHTYFFTYQYTSSYA